MILNEAFKIDFANPEKTARHVADYLDSLYELKMDNENIKKLSQLVFDRLRNRIGRDELKNSRYAGKQGRIRG